jgi:hypothetical protein
MPEKGLLRITEIPFGTTTGALMDSIVAAADKGKIKIAKIEDNTAANADILVHLPPGADPETTRDALYAFTDCELTISPNACVIADGKPQFLGVSDILGATPGRPASCSSGSSRSNSPNSPRSGISARWRRFSSKTGSTATSRNAKPGRR